MEQELHIPLQDLKTAYGILRGDYTMPLIIFVHGLTSDKNEPKFYNGSRYFDKQGCATFRWSQYSWQNDARKLHECTMSLHGKDLEAICAYFRMQGVKRIILVGHSMGALIILHADQRYFNEVIFWDGSYKVERWLEGPDVVVEGIKARFIDCGFYAPLSDALVEELKNTDYEEKLKNLQLPFSLIYAGEGALLDGYDAYWKAAAHPHKRDILPKAGHNFDEEGIEDLLFQKTLEFLM